MAALERRPAAANGDVKEERLQLRVTRDLKRQLAGAARFRGQSMSDFATHAISDAVMKVARERHVIEMSSAQSAWLADLLLHPLPPNERLISAAELYKQIIRP